MDNQNMNPMDNQNVNPMDNQNVNTMDNQYANNQYAGNQYAGNQYAGNQYMNQAPMGGYAPQDTMTVGAWLLTMIITCIPVVNIIMLIVWAAGSDPTKKSRKNWAIAQLIVMAIGIVLSFIFSAAIVALISSYAYY